MMTLVAIILLSMSCVCGCGSGSSSSNDDDQTAVTISRVNDTYYMVDLYMTKASHYEIGRQYALQIKKNVPDFEKHIDSILVNTIELLQIMDPYIDFKTLSTRANAIFANVPEDYRQEILGMQSVFSSDDDTQDNGRLSKNKLLVYALGPDVARAGNCSASAAFGSATENGKTIVGRHLEWNDYTLEDLSYLHAVMVTHNGSKSIVNSCFAGQLFVISGFNTSKVFAAILDSDVAEEYKLYGNERSYVMDLRYALENNTTIQDVAGFLSRKNYAYDFNIFLADENVAKVLENDVDTPFSGLRTSTSVLKDDEDLEPWPFANAISCVNFFVLPETVDNLDVWEGNMPRWDSFITLYGQYLAEGKITTDVMKEIMSYPGPEGDCQAENGAIWRADDGDSVMQSIIIRMDTLQTWISFQPAGKDPITKPNYIKVFSGSPF